MFDSRVNEDPIYEALGFFMNTLDLNLEINLSSRGNINVHCDWGEEFLVLPVNTRIHLLKQIIESLNGYYSPFASLFSDREVMKVPLGQSLVCYSAPVGEESKVKPTLSFQGALEDAPDVQKAICVAASTKYLIGVGNIFIAKEEQSSQ